MRKESVCSVIVLLCGSLAAACGETPSDPAATSGGASSGGSAGASSSSSSSTGTGGSSASSGSGGSSSGSGGTGGDTGGGVGTVTCSQAASPYAVSSTGLDPSFVPSQGGGWNGEWLTRVPVAVDPATGEVYVGFTQDDAVVIAKEGGTVGDAVTISGATLGGIAVTSDGLAALLFDPGTNDERLWAAVRRVGFDGAEQLSTDLFRSANLEDEGTKGEPSTSRLAYVASTDSLVAYFGHTQRYDDGVRHQGGYLATVDAAGEQTVHSGWFGSHNLDQRMIVDGDRAAVLGLGDAYPKGIFFSYHDDADTDVAVKLAANGVGSTNGQLGGMVDLGASIMAPFITDRAMPPDFDPGAWPNGDEAKIQQVGEAADNGKDLGFIQIDKASGVPDGGIEPVWLDPGRMGDAAIENLKSAPYGDGGLVLLIWAERSGGGQNASRSYFTMVIDAEGAVCQAKLALDSAYAPSSGDDIVARPDGSIVWANVQNDTIQVVTLTPQ